MVKIQKFVYVFLLRKNLLAGSKLNSEAWDILDLLRNLDFRRNIILVRFRFSRIYCSFQKSQRVSWLSLTMEKTCFPVVRN